MNADALMQILPELVLLVGACAVLMVGVGRGGRDESPVPLTALITMLVALLISIGLGDPDGRAAPRRCAGDCAAPWGCGRTPRAGP